MPRYTCQNIANARRAKGLTQHEFAPLVGRTPGTVARWEQDQLLPSADMLGVIARVLGVPVETFYDADDPEDEVTRLDAEFTELAEKAPAFTERQKDRLRELLNAPMRTTGTDTDPAIRHRRRANRSA